MDYRLQLSSLQTKYVSLPGSRDKSGRPVIFVKIPQDSPTLDLVPSLQYLTSLFSKNRPKEFTVVVDARKGPAKVIRSCIRQVGAALLTEELVQLIVLKPDGFWDKQRLENCTSFQNDKETIFIHKSRLSKFVDPNQLPTDLGGKYIYDHEKWMSLRQKAEEFYTDSEITLRDLDELHQFLSNSRTLRPSEVDEAITASADMAESTKMLVHNSTEAGKDLVQNIEYENRTRKLSSEEIDSNFTPQDTLDTIEHIHEVINEIKKKQTSIEVEWSKTETFFEEAKELRSIEEGIAKVTTWILGIGENLLNNNDRIGYDVASAEELKTAFDEIEFQCWETYGIYAELTQKIASFSDREDLSPQQREVITQKDFMDFICTNYAARLESRRNVLIVSLRFFTLVSEYFDRTGEVFDNLILGNNIGDFESASPKLKQLQVSQNVLDALESEVIIEGERLVEMLAEPMKDALGRDIAVSYSEDIANVRDILDATIARRNIFSDSIEIQKLTLQQVSLIDQYEKDVQEAIKMLENILLILLKQHGHVGCTVYEIQGQKDELLVFREIAKNTYTYACQLLNASLVLRQACKLPLEFHAGLYQKLKGSWQKMNGVSQEQIARLRVSAVFHRTIDEQCNQLRDLREEVATLSLMDSGNKSSKVDYYFILREKLITEVGRMVRIGKLLRSRLKENLCPDEALLLSTATKNSPIESPFTFTRTSCENNKIASDAISDKLAEVSQLSEELDQALKSAHQDCIVFSTSSASTTCSCSIESSESSLCSAPKDFGSMDSNPGPSEKPPKPDETRSEEEEFHTASDGTLQHSRSSSYNTASECEQRFSPWWQHGKEEMKENIAKEKMVLGVGLPDLPPVKEVLKSSPEVPPGKIVREVVETTHIKVQQQHTMGVKSFVLTSETVRDKNEAYTTREETVRLRDEHGKEVLIPVDVDEGEFERRIKEVSGTTPRTWRSYRRTTKQVMKGCI